MEKVEKGETKLATHDDLADLAKRVRGYVDPKLKEVQEAVCALRSEMEKPTELKAQFYRCSEEGCKFVTDDLAKFVEHVVDEKLSSPSSTTPEETEPERPRRHKTWDEFLDCPTCAPKFEKLLLEKGWKKPEPKPEPKGFL